MTFLSIIIAILIFGIIITIHELGHFLVAKACKIKVNEFSIGMGPVIFKKTKGDTQYALRLLPIGGYVSMEGEDKSSDDENAFANKSVWKRLAVVVAGATMNILLGFIILVITTSTAGDITSTTISKFSEDAMSNKTGLMEGDKIVSINGMRIFVDNDIVYQFQTDKDAVFDMTVIRDGKKVELKDVTFDTVPDSDGNSTLKIDFFVKPIKRNPLTVVSYSAGKTVSVARTVWLSLKDLVTGKYKINDLSGPVGIVDAIGDVIQDSGDRGMSFGQILNIVLTLAVFITINVGIFNLLPFPALDGGRCVFLIIEAIRGKPVKPEHEGFVHFIGFALLILLIIIVTFSDIFKIFS